jgi:hypothetical protein
MLECDVCRCSAPKPAKGWTAVFRYDPEGIGGTWVVAFCPPCSAAEFGHRPDVGTKYVCIFEPQPRPTEPN